MTLTAFDRTVGFKPQAAARSKAGGCQGDDLSGYGSFVRGASGTCSSSDWRYLTQPCMNCGQSGTTGIGSVFSGKSPHSAG